MYVFLIMEILLLMLLLWRIIFLNVNVNFELYVKEMLFLSDEIFIIYRGRIKKFRIWLWNDLKECLVRKIYCFL